MKARYKKVRHKKPNRSFVGNFINVLFIALMGGFMLLPFLYAVSSAFKPLDEIFVYPPRFFVNNPTLSNFNDLFILLNSSWVPFSRYFTNTLYITVLGTTGHVFIASLGAYIFAKHDFFGRNTLFAIVVMSLMFVGQVTYIPNYIILSKLHLINTPYSLIIPAFAGPLGLFLMKQFMEGLPDSLIESAKIDGAKELTIFIRIAMPLVKPAWLTLIIFSIQNLWNNNANMYIYKEQLKTLPFALQQVIAGGIARTGEGSAAALILMIVPITVFIISQTSIIETMAHSGIKE